MKRKSKGKRQKAKIKSASPARTDAQNTFKRRLVLPPAPFDFCPLPFDFLFTIVFDMVQLIMQEIPISKFKATCLSVMERVKTRQPVRATRFGDPVAEIVPPTPARPPKSWLGAMAGSGRIAGDIVSPASDEQDWDVLRR